MLYQWFEAGFSAMPRLVICVLLLFAAEQLCLAQEEGKPKDKKAAAGQVAPAERAEDQEDKDEEEEKADEKDEDQEAGEDKAAPAKEEKTEAAEGKEAASESAATAPATEPEESALARQLADYLHFAMIGRFELADNTYAKPLLARPEVNPLTDQAAEQLVAYAKRHENAVETLIILVNNREIGPNAAKILELINAAHRRQRMKPVLIKDSLQLLAGDPMQQAVALKRLIDSGEYAVPWMLAALDDPQQKKLYPYLVKALPELGKKALNPLIAALEIRNAAIRSVVIETLGRIGYPQALPYLQRIATEAKEDALLRHAAAQAVERIAGRNPDVLKAAAVTLFNELAEKYYDREDSLTPDPREPRSNVWYFRGNVNPGDDPVEPVEVPRDIYCPVMCMRCCELSLRLNPRQPTVAALWLAANFRREIHLGMDVQAEDPQAELAERDRTRPAGFLRSIYYARLAGPLYSQMVLRRAIKDRDREVALGAVAALDATAGPAALAGAIDPQGMSLAEALRFPDLQVRIKAALALGRMAPRQSFPGADQVAPTLAAALSLRGNRFYMLVDPTVAVREALVRELSKDAVTVVAAERLGPALEQARKELTHLDGIFLATDMQRPTVLEACRQLARDERFALTPLVLVVKEGGTAAANRAVEMDRRIGRVLTVAENDLPEPGLAALLLEELDKTASKYGYQKMSEEMSLALALQAADTLHALAAGNLRLAEMPPGLSGLPRPVFDVAVAEPALINLLAGAAKELRAAALQVLALLNSTEAQRQIAKFALNGEQDAEQRKSALTALADSARRIGHRLDEPTTKALLEMSLSEADVALRTAASKAVGAMNLPVNQVAEQILLHARP